MVLVTLAAVLVCATLSSAGSNLDEHFDSCSAPLRGIAHLLNLPIPATNPDDIRSAVLPLGVGLLLIGTGFFRFKVCTTPLKNQYQARIRNAGQVFIYLASGCLFIAVASTFYNHTWLLSRGWMLGLLSAGVWAMLLMRSANTTFVARALNLAIIIGAYACALVLWHRHEANFRYVDWPIGPLTVCAAVAATVGTLAAGRIICLFLNDAPMSPRKWMAIGLLVVVLLFAVTTLIASERTGPWLGMAGGVGLIAAVAILKRYPTKNVRLGVITTVVVGLLFTGLFVWRETSTSGGDKARSFGVRMIYWKKIASELPSTWTLGVGPDMFMPRMTTLLARQRAEMPHVLHGYVDTEAHNEWLQAVYELGFVGGLLYVAIPLLAIGAALRAGWKAAPATANASLPIAGGLTAILIIESASINLRHATLSAWYWTFIGLAFACAVPPIVNSSSLPHKKIQRVVAVLSILLGGAFIYITCVDINRSIHYARGRENSGTYIPAAVESLSQARGRLGAWQWLTTEYDYVTAVTQLTEMKSAPPQGWKGIVAMWEYIDRICPAYLDTGWSLARTMSFAEEIERPKLRLKRQLDNYNPYDPLTILVYLHLAAPSATERLELVVRALREADLDQNFAKELDTSTNGPELKSLAFARAEAAARDAGETDLARWHDALAPEVLRVAAQLAIATGDIHAAARWQNLAAACYQKLRDSESPVRRRVFAEVDAEWKAALYSFQVNPDSYDRPFQMICNAERILASELAHDTLRNIDAELGFVGGEVVLRELPAKFNDLWRFSSGMYLLQGRQKAAAIRLSYSLPTERRGDSDILTEQRVLAKWLVDIYATRPASQRPKTYEMLLRLSTSP